MLILSMPLNKGFLHLKKDFTTLSQGIKSGTAARSFFLFHANQLLQWNMALLARVLQTYLWFSSLRFSQQIMRSKAFVLYPHIKFPECWQN